MAHWQHRGIAGKSIVAIEGLPLGRSLKKMGTARGPRQVTGVRPLGLCIPEEDINQRVTGLAAEEPGRKHGIRFLDQPGYDQRSA